MQGEFGHVRKMSEAAVLLEPKAEEDLLYTEAVHGDDACSPDCLRDSISFATTYVCLIIACSVVVVYASLVNATLGFALLLVLATLPAALILTALEHRYRAHVLRCQIAITMAECMLLMIPCIFAEIFVLEGFAYLSPRLAYGASDEVRGTASRRRGAARPLTDPTRPSLSRPRLPNCSPPRALPLLSPKDLRRLVVMHRQRRAHRGGRGLDRGVHQVPRGAAHGRRRLRPVRVQQRGSRRASVRHHRIRRGRRRRVRFVGGQQRARERTRAPVPRRSTTLSAGPTPSRGA